MASPSALALARELAHLADLKKAEAIVVLDISAHHSLIDCFVIATARSAKQGQVLGEDALAHVKSGGLKPWHLEKASDWICGDFGDVVFHVFTPEAREYYDLEALWADAERVAWEPAPARGNTVSA